MGVSNVSHVDLLKDTDLSDYVTVINFRQLQKDRQEKNKENKNNSGGTKKNGSNDGYTFTLEECLPDFIWKKLQLDEEILLDTERTTVINCVGHSINSRNKVIRADDVFRKATTIIRAHPTSLGCLMLDEEEVMDAANVFSNSIISHIRYLQSLELKRKRKILGTQNANDGNKTKRKKSDNFTKSQNFGLDPNRDLPSELPPGETKQTQEAKRAALVEMNSQGQKDLTVIMKTMSETYVTARIDINKKMRIEPFLKRWPFIGMYPVLESHYEALMDAKVNDLLSQLNLKFESVERFFEAESHQMRKGKTTVSSELRDHIKMFRNLGSNVNSGHRFILTVKCAIILMKLKADVLFVHFEETTSFDELQGSDEFPADGRPIVAVLGKNPFSQDAKAFVVVENRCIHDEPISVYKATLMAFMCYFVFKISYSKEAAPILYFLHSKVFKVKGAGTKTKREKKNGKYQSAPPARPEKYLTFFKLYKEYCLLWNMEH